jgi:hypothetical protein
MPRIGIVKRKGWAHGLAVRETGGLPYMGLDEKTVRICTIITENHQMSGGIVAVRDVDVTWGK